MTANDKPTYVLAKVPIEEGNVDAVADAVVTLSERYLDAKSGSIPWKQFPSILQTEIVARIPPAVIRDSDHSN